MGIYVNEANKEFHLQTEKTSYIFTLLKNNQLGQLYYGKKINHRSSFQHLFTIKPRATITNIYEGDHTFSLETIKQEYPSYGTTDFREPAFQILQEDGSRITNFEYHTHHIYQGKQRLEGLPATYVENEEEAVTLEVSLYDKLIDAEIILSYSVFEKLNVITRAVKFINQGTQNLNITRAMSVSVDLFDSNFKMVQLSGSWGRERYVKARYSKYFKHARNE